MEGREGAARTAALERVLAGVRGDLAAVNEEMERLRAQGKAGTATYRQLMANRMTLRQMDQRFKEQGL